ncbi:MAG: endopeptidase La [Bacteroidaceae bacterium]|nr:endopeptidase La [Bacteroidaceae bacterium]
MNQDNQNPFSFIAEFDGDEKSIYDISFDETLPVMPLRDITLFPGVILPITVGRTGSIRVCRRAFDEGSFIVCATQKSPEVESPQPSDLYDIAVVSRVVRIFEMPDDTTTALVQGFVPVTLSEVFASDGTLVGHVAPLHEQYEEMNSQTYKLLRETLRTQLREFISLNEQFGPEAQSAINNVSSMRFFVNFVCANMPIDVATKIRLLRELNPVLRAMELLREVSREIQYSRIRSDIRQKTQVDIDQQQRNYFLQRQLQNIQEELGNGPSDDAMKLRQRAEDVLWNKDVEETFYEELAKLERMNPQSPDYQVQVTYLETLVKLPWNLRTISNYDLRRAERVLEKNHYGMKEVKERILEHIAVRYYSYDAARPTILCLYGPPGVGKTSLCRSIADAMGRKYVRASLGGLHDEAEIRGHRRTYIGAMPGRIIKSLIKAESCNPVFVLDEIDKITENTINGDPASALLEVLDPEQNKAFHDNFLEVDVDLSDVMFIATANTISTIPRPLLDRMELIEVNGYITEEKVQIAKRHLVPRVKEGCGLSHEKDIKLNKAALEFLIENYTRESGVRGLEKELDRLFRRMVLYHERHQEFPVLKVTPADIQQILGKPKYQRDTYQGNGFAGVVTGLAWTSVGGEILFIETSLSRGKGQKLTLTGNLGDVMKESAILALEFIKAHADDIGVDIRIFDHYNIHIHVPEGAVPKDGPSAGITMATSLVSALTQRKVRRGIAMTGEITLRGKVLPVGGIKEKILAAKRAGISDVILCADNRKDIEDIEELYVRGLTFHYVDNVLEVLHYALLDEQVAHPIQFVLNDDVDKH